MRSTEHRLSACAASGYLIRCFDVSAEYNSAGRTDCKSVFRWLGRSLSAWNFHESRQYEPDDRDSDWRHDSAGDWGRRDLYSDLRPAGIRREYFRCGYN